MTSHNPLIWLKSGSSLSLCHRITSKFTLWCKLAFNFALQVTTIPPQNNVKTLSLIIAKIYRRSALTGKCIYISVNSPLAKILPSHCFWPYNTKNVFKILYFCFIAIFLPSSHCSPFRTLSLSGFWLFSRVWVDTVYFICGFSFPTKHNTSRTQFWQNTLLTTTFSTITLRTLANESSVTIN